MPTMKENLIILLSVFLQDSIAMQCNVEKPADLFFDIGGRKKKKRGKRCLPRISYFESSMYLFNKERLCVMHWADCWEYRGEQDCPVPCLHRILLLHLVLEQYQL